MQTFRPQNRLQNIEVLRGVAILMVMLLHLPKLLPTTYSWYLPPGWLGRFNLSVGVDVFFGVSGFVVARTLRRDLNDLRLREGLAYTLKFWTRRAFRLWPVAWIGLFAAFLVSEVFNRLGTMNPGLNLQLIPAGMGMYVNFLYRYAWQHNEEIGTMSQYWSLSLEEQFYGVLPLLMILTRRAALPLLLVYVAGWWVLSTQDLASAIVFRPGCLVAGVLLAELEASSIWNRLHTFNLSGADKAVGCFLLLGLAAFAAAIQPWDTILGVRLFWLQPVLVTLVCFALVLFAAIEETVDSPGKLAGALIFVGSRSYVYYVVHNLTYPMAQEMLFRIAPNMANDLIRCTLLVLLALFLLVGCSELLVRFVERPLRLLGRRLTENDPPTLTDPALHKS